MSVFSRDAIRVGKPQTSRRKRLSGTDGEVLVSVSAPLDILGDNWNRLSDTTKVASLVEARLDFVSGKSPKKKEPVWNVHRGTSLSSEVIARELTFNDAVEYAKTYVMGAN